MSISTDGLSLTLPRGDSAEIIITPYIEGSWSNITKDSSWNYNSGSDNIKIIDDSYLYKNADRIIEHYLKGR